MARTRHVKKSWANAYVSEQRQPGGHAGGGQWTRGNINPLAAAAQRNAEAVARQQALASGRGGAGPDAEDQAEAARGRDLMHDAAALEGQIDQLQRELKSVRSRLQAIGAAPGASSSSSSSSNVSAVSQQARPGSAPGASTGSSGSTSALQSRAADLRGDIKALKKRRAKLLRQARILLRDSQKALAPSITKGNRVAVVIAPEATKATTLTADGEVAYFSIPIEKQEETAEINPVDGTPDLILWGKATDGTLDSDLQIVDPDWSEKALRDWKDRGAALRVMHQAKRDPAGTGLDVQGHYIKTLVSEPAAKHLVRTKALRDFSVGIANPDVRVGDPRFKHLDPMGKAVNGVITGRPDGLSQIVEVSLCDRGSNHGARFAIVKAASDGSPEWVGKLTGPADLLAKAAGGTLTKAAKPVRTVTVDLPANMSFSVKPSDLAKLATFRQRLARDEAATKAAAATPAKAAVTPVPEPEDDALTTIKAAEAAVYKRDIDTATRRRLASEGNALPNLSYPIENEGDLANAATLARSGHGDVGAARRLISRRAKELGVKNPLKASDKIKDGKKKATKAAEPDMTKCEPCGGTGMAGGKPCGSCKKGRKLAKKARKAEKKQVVKALRHLDAFATAVAGPDVAKKKSKVMCPHCGARQNAKHNACSECGKPLDGAIPVMKNHAYTCLGCGKDLDKGERFCPNCGKENPGYLPEADHQIPANRDAEKAAKGKSKGKPGKGKKGKPFGGQQAPAFGKDKDGDSDDDTSKKAAARVTKGKKNGKGGGKGPTPGSASGAVGQHESPAPPHREPDGSPVEAFERDARLEDGDSEGATHLESLTGAHKAYGDPEVMTALKCKSLGVPLSLGMAHDLCCPAYAPADVANAHPQGSFKSLDLSDWQARAIDSAAGLPLEEARKGLELWNAALALKNADPFELADIREGLHKAFRDANPGPGHFPTPGTISAERFRRPYISEGHAAPSPGHDAPHHVSLPPMGGIDAQDYTRGYISAGHAEDSPGNEHAASPAPPAQTGVASSAMARTYYRNSAREGARHAMSVLHDHISATFPDLCPIHGAEDIGRHPVPTPQGVPDTHPAPGAKKARKAGKAAKVKARKQRKAAAAKRLRMGRRVLKGALTVEQARAKLGLEPVAAKTATAPAAEPAAAALDPGALKAAMAEANAPLLERLAAQDKRLRKQAKALDAIASQPDTSAAPFRGVAATKTPAAPAGPLGVTKSAAQTEDPMLAMLYDVWRNTPDPLQQEAAWAEIGRRTWNKSMQPPQM